MDSSKSNLKVVGCVVSRQKRETPEFPLLQYFQDAVGLNNVHVEKPKKEKDTEEEKLDPVALRMKKRNEKRTMEIVNQVKQHHFSSRNRDDSSDDDDNESERSDSRKHALKETTLQKLRELEKSRNIKETKEVREADLARSASAGGQWTSRRKKDAVENGGGLAMDKRKRQDLKQQRKNEKRRAEVSELLPNDERDEGFKNGFPNRKSGSESGTPRFATPSQAFPAPPCVNKWSERPGNSLFDKAHQTVCVPDLKHYDEEQMIRMAIEESLRTAEREASLRFVRVEPKYKELSLTNVATSSKNCGYPVVYVSHDEDEEDDGPWDKFEYVSRSNASDPAVIESSAKHTYCRGVAKDEQRKDGDWRVSSSEASSLETESEEVQNSTRAFTKRGNSSQNSYVSRENHKQQNSFAMGYSNGSQKTVRNECKDGKRNISHNGDRGQKQRLKEWENPPRFRGVAMSPAVDDAENQEALQNKVASIGEDTLTNGQIEPTRTPTAHSVDPVFPSTQEDPPRTRGTPSRAEAHEPRPPCVVRDLESPKQKRSGELKQQKNVKWNDVVLEQNELKTTFSTSSLSPISNSDKGFQHVTILNNGDPGTEESVNIDEILSGDILKTSRDLHPQSSRTSVEREPPKERDKPSPSQCNPQKVPTSPVILPSQRLPLPFSNLGRGMLPPAFSGGLGGVPLSASSLIPPRFPSPGFCPVPTYNPYHCVQPFSKLKRVATDLQQSENTEKQEENQNSPSVPVPNTNACCIPSLPFSPVNNFLPYPGYPFKYVPFPGMPVNPGMPLNMVFPTKTENLINSQIPTMDELIEETLRKQSSPPCVPNYGCDASFVPNSGQHFSLPEHLVQQTIPSREHLLRLYNLHSQHASQENVKTNHVGATQSLSGTVAPSELNDGLVDVCDLSGVPSPAPLNSRPTPVLPGYVDTRCARFSPAGNPLYTPNGYFPSVPPNETGFYDPNVARMLDGRALKERAKLNELQRLFMNGSGFANGQSGDPSRAQKVIDVAALEAEIKKLQLQQSLANSSLAKNN